MYYVTFNLTTLPPSYGVTRQDVGDNSTDSDANPATGQTEITSFLSSAQKDLSLDLGIVAPNLALTKQADSETVRPGVVVLYTLIYTNTGFGASYNAVIHERVPDHTSFVNASSSPGWSCANGAPAGTECTFALPTLVYNQQGTVTFAVRIDPNLTGAVTIPNTAVIVNGNSEPEATTPDNQDETQISVEIPTSVTPVEEPVAAYRIYFPVAAR